jgi:hypothetical protein
VNFPLLLVAARDGENFPIPQARIGVRCRHTFPLEVEYLYSRIKSKKLSIWQKSWSFLEFALLSMSPDVKSDLLFPGDRMLYARSILSVIDKFLR